MLNSKFIYSALLSTAILIVSGCSLTPPKSNNIDGQIDTILQNSIRANKRAIARNHHTTHNVNEALLKNSAFSEEKIQNEKRFDITVNSVPARSFFMGLVKGTPYSVSIKPDVLGDISLDLKNVTVEEALETVHEMYGYEYQRNAESYIISPRQLKTEIFSINYLDIDRTGKSNTTISSGEITRTITGPSLSGGARSSQDVIPISSIQTDTHADFWKQLTISLTLIVGDKDGHSIVVNPQAGLIIVKAYPDELRKVAQYLDSIQNIIKRQVIIEAKILEVELNANYQSGIDWNILGAKAKDATFGDNLRALDEISSSQSGVTNPSMFTVNAKSGWAFNSVIKLLNTQGKVHTISSPRIATLNNQKAVIKIGRDQFFVTNVSSNTSVGSSTTTGQNVELTPFFSGIALDVTPQISSKGSITLHIHPVISNVTEETKDLVVAGLTQKLPLARSTIRESDNIVQAENGQVIVIGGLMENNSAAYQAGLPGVERARGLSGLLKKISNASRKFELVILLKPTVIENSNWNSVLKETQKQHEAMPKNFNYDLKPYKGPEEKKCDLRKNSQCDIKRYHNAPLSLKK